MKNNPLQTFRGVAFGVSQSKVSQIIPVLLTIFDQTLKQMDLSPCRDGEILQFLLSPHPQKVFTYDVLVAFDCKQSAEKAPKSILNL